MLSYTSLLIVSKNLFEFTRYVFMGNYSGKKQVSLITNPKYTPNKSVQNVQTRIFL